MTAPRTAQITHLVVLAVATVLLAVVAYPLWKPLFLATVLSALLDRPNAWITRKLGRRRRLGAAVTTLLLVIVVLVPITILTVIGVTEAIGAVEFARGALRRGGIDELMHMLPSGIEGPLRELVALVPSSFPGQVGGEVAGLVSRAIAMVGNLSFSLVMMLIAFYALLISGDALFLWIRRVSPLPETGELLTEARNVSVNVLRSAFITALAQGTLATIGYSIASVPNAVFFGVLTFFVAFIPSVGTSLVAIPVIALLALSGQTWQPIFLLGWFALLVGFIDNLLNPLLIRGGMHLNGVIVFFSLIGGIIVFGAIGILVGPLAITFFLVMIRGQARPPIVESTALEPTS